MILIIAIAVLVALPAWILAIEVFAGLRPMKSTVGGDAPPFAVIIPAHNEALGITDTVMAVRAQLRSRDRLVVVADNCSDETAALARSAGAEVIERHDAHRRGKGFALAFGRDFLGAKPPAVAIVIDADCRPGPGALEALAAHAGNSNCAVQGLNLITISTNESPLVQIATFAFMVKNLIRQRGLQRLGAPGLLQGTGMAFPWLMFKRASLATDNVVEDMVLGLDLLRQGHVVQWIEAASVSSLAASQSATVTQRTRWEQGFLATAVANVPRLLWSSIKQRRVSLALVALDLLVPPLALLVGLLMMGGTMAGLVFAFTRAAAPLAIVASALAAVAISVALAWSFEGRRYLSFRTLSRAPAYVLWKLPIYFRLVGKREKSWVRTEREN